jgi:hypothetical protein
MEITTHTVLCWIGWFVGCIAMSLISGWWQLARRFPAGTSSGERWYFVSGSVTKLFWLPVQYHATFFMTLSEDGVRLSVFFPVRLLHPPLQLPWTAVSRVSTQSFLFFFQQTQLELANSQVRFRIRGRAGQALLRHYSVKSGQIMIEAQEAV